MGGRGPGWRERKAPSCYPLLFARAVSPGCVPADRSLAGGPVLPACSVYKSPIYLAVLPLFLPVGIPASAGGSPDAARRGRRRGGVAVWRPRWTLGWHLSRRFRPVPVATLGLCGDRPWLHGGGDTWLIDGGPGPRPADRQGDAGAEKCDGGCDPTGDPQAGYQCGAGRSRGAHARMVSSPRERDAADRSDARGAAGSGPPGWALLP